MPAIAGSVFASDLITDALQELGVAAAGEPLNSTDAAKGLAVLSRLIDTTNTGRAATYSPSASTSGS